jgi:hypothetical protein
MTLKKSATVCFSTGVFQLLEGLHSHYSLENALVAEAIRRSTSKLSSGASLDEIRDYLSNYSGDSLRGLLANVKGIYHELIFTNAENHDNDSITARIFEETNHPGADVEFLSDGNVISEVQLKAVMDKDIILQHFEKYPDIAVFATSEIAGQFENVSDSGFSNKELEREVMEFAAEFGIEDLLGKASKGFVIGGAASLIWSIAEAIKTGRITRNDLKRAVKDGSISAAFGAAVDLLLG